MFNFLLKLLPTVNCDVAEPWQLSFQDGASPSFEGIVDLHDQIMFYLVIIVIGVSWMLGIIIVKFNTAKNPIVYKYFTHGTVIELIWTVTPAFVLVAIAFPSFRLLYLMDEVIDPAITVKAVGSQWFWSYEYSDYISDSGEPIAFDSFMVPEADLEEGQFRLLEVDNRVVLPVDTHVRFILTGSDVIHSFAVPALGLKLDAIPGRLNQTSTFINREGLFYGQCSEICGVNHGFMPIVIESVSLEKYMAWLNEQLNTPLSEEALLTLSVSTILINYAKDRKKPFSIDKPQVPANISPWFITGYSDAEACFDLTIVNSKALNSGFRVAPRFRITGHKRDITLLFMIKEYFNCGVIGKIDAKDCLDYTVADQNSLLNIIIPFFNKYPLRGTKHLDFLDWQKGLEIIRNKGHLTLEGVCKIRLIKTTSNTGRIFNINYINSHCDSSDSSYIPLDGNYISGFLAGDGYLSLISKIESPSFGRMRIGFTQHQNNYLLLQSIKDYFNIDNLVITKTNVKAISLNCGSEYSVYHTLLPFFKEYPIYGIKAITLVKLLKIRDLVLSLRGSRKTTKWTPELKSQVLNIWEDNSILLKVDASI